VSKDLKQDVMEGKSLSSAMTKQPRIFTDMYVNMVQAGEQSGALVEVLRRLATHYERFAEVQQKFVSALIYPDHCGLRGHLHHHLFHDVHAAPVHDDLPRAESRVAVCHARAHAHQQFLQQPHVLGGDGRRGRVRRHLLDAVQGDGGRKAKIDSWKMYAPVFGKVIRLNLFGQFARTLSTLLINGVPVLTALKNHGANLFRTSSSRKPSPARGKRSRTARRSRSRWGAANCFRN